jgi:O-antigen/teichoic acid export membrane protein
MWWIAITSVVESALKLAIALFLFDATGDRLILYALFTVGSGFVVLLLQSTYCLRKYEECSINHFWAADKRLVKELVFFSGWNLFGTLCSLGRSQGLSVLLNVFFGPLLNAAYAIANQITGQLGFFSITMLQTLSPQIMKSEGAGERQKMLYLSMLASKFCFFLLSIVAIPCLFEMKTILTLWLEDVPEHTLVFCQLVLIGALTNQLTIGLQTALQAIGKIKLYQIIVGSLLLLNLPISYCLLRLNYPAYSVLISYCFIELLACSLRIIFMVNIGGLSWSMFFHRVIKKEVIPVIISVSFCLFIVTAFSFEYRFVVTIMVSAIVFLIGIYYTGLCQDERMIMDKLFLKYWGKIKTVKG